MTQYKDTPTQDVQEKIKKLLSDKRTLKQRIKKDEEDLKRRILELSSLYDTSNALGYTLNHQQIAHIVIDALVKVLNFDMCTIFIWGVSTNGELITRINKPLPKTLIEKIQQNVLNALSPFTKQEFILKKITNTIDKRYSSTKRTSKENTMKSFANVPLIFKEEVIGILSVCSDKENAFPRNEMTFLHTMANQLASNLGRLKMVQKLEKSKMGTLIESMKDGVMMLDENHQVTIINPEAKQMLNIEKIEPHDSLTPILKQMELFKLYRKVLKSKKPLSNEKISHNDKSYSVTISPVTTTEQGYLGTVFVFHDITEIERIDRIKTQRLKVISKVDLIIKSIHDLDNLLSVLMEFILNIASAEMGSIQLKENNVFFSKVHSNFPDKVRRFYRFKNGTTISDHVIETQQTCFIDNYSNNKKMVSNPKIAIDTYICIPILVKNELIGIINIAQKADTLTQKLTADDINTLTTISTLSGTAIQNAQLYQDTLIKEKLEQEIHVAKQIQKKLLPETVPTLKKVDFGAVSIPARDIGGDYYDFIELNNGQIGIVVADMVGKGIPAGLFMAMLKSILRTHITTIYSPKEALQLLNTVLCRDKVISKFIPLIYAILDPQTLTLKISNAGHEPGILFSKNKFTTLDTKGCPLGAYEESSFEEKEYQLEPEDIVVLLTDGIIEARNAKKQIFGYKRLKNIIKKNHPLSANELVTSIHTHINEFSYPKIQHDDLTLLIFRIGQKMRSKTNEKPIASNEITVKSSKANIKEIRNFTQNTCQKMGVKESDIFDIKLAVNEAHANVIEHAYFGSERGDIKFVYEKFKDRLKITITDWGKNTGQTIKGDEKYLGELEGSGLGLYLIKSIMDNVQYEKQPYGTNLHLTKFFTKKRSA